MPPSLLAPPHLAPIPTWLALRDHPDFAGTLQCPQWIPGQTLWSGLTDASLAPLVNRALPGAKAASWLPGKSQVLKRQSSRTPDSSAESHRLLCLPQNHHASSLPGRWRQAARLPRLHVPELSLSTSFLLLVSRPSRSRGAGHLESNHLSLISPFKYFDLEMLGFPHLPLRLLFFS